MPVIVYVIELDSNRDWHTLVWLSNRGYDGNVLALAEDIAHYDEGERTQIGLTEQQAWEFRDYVDSDPDAFLACCGSETLAKVLNDLFLDII